MRKFLGATLAPVEVLVCITEVVTERADTFLPDVVHVDAGLGHQDAAKDSQLRQTNKTRARWVEAARGEVFLGSV